MNDERQAYVLYVQVRTVLVLNCNSTFPTSASFITEVIGSYNFIQYGKLVPFEAEDWYVFRPGLT
jgi:hypothetical protein